ncbi:hypothetical protein N599_20315 [Saccharopolyspora erythraea D]|nr:hypothetical protein N599_20315 [Saccharopolyspora erythraea D]
MAVNTAIAAVKLVRDAGLVTIKRHVGAQVRDRTEDVDVAGEINAVRQAVVGLRVEVDRVSAELADLEARLAMLAERSGSDTT